jgi:hypothetical protein
VAYLPADAGDVYSLISPANPAITLLVGLLLLPPLALFLAWIIVRRGRSD